MWTLRCQLELQRHDRAGFATLTYDDDNVPDTLEKRDLQLFFKRLRKNAVRPIRYFACGEYGERNKRPHYHAVLFGLDERDRDLLHDSWGLGRTQTVNVTAAAIAYTAGYTAKKQGFRKGLNVDEKIDVATGIIQKWQHPFLQMSRRPGIGAWARQHANSWRLFAVMDGNKMPVPRYLHNAWKNQATPAELEALISQKSMFAALKDTSRERLLAAEQISLSQSQLSQTKRDL